MGQLSIEQVEYAIASLVRIVAYRRLTQTELGELSGVTQPTISKILSHSQKGDDNYSPTEEILSKLFQGLGLKLHDILNEPDCLPERIYGYLATPLTALTETAHKALRKAVNDMRAVAADTTFDSCPFDIYWPGDHTHPVDHPNLQARQVYLTDRSRASSHDFIILFCGDPSYGVGQENEIATQAGTPAIRLIPPRGTSRMMLGSFVRAIDITYEGTLESLIKIPREELLKALQEIRRIYFRHRAFYKKAHDEAFGNRFKRLIVDRCSGNYIQCADDLGITLDYLHALMEEPFSVSNPSARLLDRIAIRLSTRVSYLLGELEETDPVVVASNASWRKWVDEGVGIDASIALQMLDKWNDDHHRTQRTRGDISVTSFRTAAKLMQVKDWDQLYQTTTKAKGGQHPIQPKML
jgi:transcriptional regulator with XRE-family HTH domain